MNTTVKSILNGWKNSIEKYNKLDSWKLREQLSTIGKYLRSNDDTKAIVKMVHLVRDCAICPNPNMVQIHSQINKILNMDEVSKMSACLFTKKSMVELNYKDRANALKERHGVCLMSVCVLKTTCF